MSLKAASDQRATSPIVPPKGRPLVTLKDAANYIQKLPKAEQDLEEWQAAVEALLLVVELNGPTMKNEPQRSVGSPATEWSMPPATNGCVGPHHPTWSVVFRTRHTLGRRLLVRARSSVLSASVSGVSWHPWR
jgi:hypothetical protein